MFGFKKKQKEVEVNVEERGPLSMSERLARALNYMYAGIVNGESEPVKGSPDYVSAVALLRNKAPYTGESFEQMENAILEFLAVYTVLEKGRVKFVPSEVATVDLHCNQRKYRREISFNEKGVIVRDEKFEKNKSSKKETNEPVLGE